MTALIEAPAPVAAEDAPYRVIVTGSRTWTATIPVHRELERVYDETICGPLIVVHGNARGADRIARDWVREMDKWGHDVSEERHEPDWDQYGKAAGFIRNEHMISLGARLVLAFLMPCDLPRCRARIVHPTHGAGHCAEKAEQAAIEVRRIEASR